MIIQRTANEIIFRFPNNMKLDDLQGIVDYFEYLMLVKGSTASQKVVDNLVKSVKKGRWERTKQQL